MRTKRWIGAAVVASILTMALGAVAGGNERITIVGGTPGQRTMALWAVGRFQAEGLAVPPLEIRFHVDRRDCRDRLGYYIDGVADICGIHANLMARRTILHEMAHGWLESNLSERYRARFLGLRGLRTWNDNDVPWEERGFEQGAEIMGWALCDQGTGIHRPLIPDNSIEELAAAYRALTGRALPRGIVAECATDG